MAMSRAMSSTFDLYPRDTFFRFKDEQWMKKVNQRIAHEQDPEK